MNKYLVPGLVALVVIAGGVAYASQSGVFKEKSDGAMMKSEEEMKKDAKPTAVPDEAMMKKEKEQEAMAMKKDAGAAFIPFTSEADAQALVKDHGKDVVYFFDASWCPDCQAIQKKLENPGDISKLGANTVIVKADYDKEKDLKKKYAISHQTAFVRIDAEGKALKQGILSNYDDVLTF
jgi:thiol-disulfide isomerase/thioredoxin